MACAILQHGTLHHRQVTVRAVRNLTSKFAGKCWLVGAGPGSVDFLTVSTTIAGC